MARKTQLRESLPSFWRTLRHFAGHIRAERRLIASSMAMLLLGIALRLAEPWPLKFVLDRLIGSGANAAVPDWLVAIDARVVLGVAAAAIVAVSIARAGCDFLYTLGFARVGNRVMLRVREELFRHLQALPLSFHARARTGDLVVRVTRDVNMLRDVTSTALLPMVANVLVFVGMAAVMVLLDWQLTLVAAAVAPLFWWTTARTGRRIHGAAKDQRRREGALASTAAESIGAIRVVQSLSLEDAFAEEFAGRNAKSQKEDLKVTRLSARLERGTDVLRAAATAAVVWFGALRVLRVQMSPGDLIVFLAYLRRAFNPAKDFAKYTARLAKAAAAGDRVVELLVTEPEIADRPGAVAAPRLAGDVRFDRVRFGYEPGHDVLAGFDLTIAAGQFVALVGPSGIGKSTLASLLLRLYDPAEGSVSIDGHDVREFTIASLRSQMSVVLQDTILFTGTIADNIAHGAGEVPRERIEAAAELADAAAFVGRMPRGYDSEVGERGGTLSHGQRQRLAIARAALRDGSILILDEPTTGLDETSRRAVIDALCRLARGRTTLLITHDLELASRAGLVVYLDGGKAAEVGRPDDLVRRGGRYATLLRQQLGGLDEAENPAEQPD